MAEQRITPHQAEALAAKAVGDYITACNLSDGSQIGDVLMKLVSVAGVVMAHAEGSEVASARLIGTAKFIEKRMPKNPATLRPIQ